MRLRSPRDRTELNLAVRRFKKVGNVSLVERKMKWLSVKMGYGPLFAA